MHEAFIELAGQRRVLFETRGHFLAVASLVMRRILIEHARNRAALKRGGGYVMPLTLDPDALEADAGLGEISAVDAAITALEKLDARAARVMVLRFFGGALARRHGRSARRLRDHREARVGRRESMAEAGADTVTGPAGWSYVWNQPLTLSDPTGFAGFEGCSLEACDIETVITSASRIPSLFYSLPPNFDWGQHQPGGFGDPSMWPIVSAPVPTKNTQGQSTMAQKPAATNCPAPNTVAKDTAAVPFLDDRGNPILNSNNQTMMRPSGFDPHFFTRSGALDLARMQRPGTLYVNSLANFRIGGPWDAQRDSGGNFIGEFRDYASVAIGLYAGAAGLTQNQIVGMADTYAGTASNFSSAQMDYEFRNLPSLNVTNMQLGFNLQQSGQVCTPTQ